MASSNIEEAMVAYLSSLPDLTTIIGTRLEPMKIAQTLPKPYLAYEQMEDKPYGALTVCSGNPLCRAVYKLLAVGDTEKQVNAIVQVLRTQFLQGGYFTFDNYSGVSARLLNTYHEEQKPYLGSDVYPYTKASFLSMQYVDPC